MSKELDDAGIEIKAVSYILIGLIQRLDASQPGFVPELLDGMRSDRESWVLQGKSDRNIDNIFDKAIKLLERADVRKFSADLT